MNTITVTIKDLDDGTLSLEGRLERPEAINEPPTPALVVASFLAAHSSDICDAAVEWFLRQIKEAEQPATVEGQQ